jgi:hypothetical protein
MALVISRAPCTGLLLVNPRALDLRLERRCEPGCKQHIWSAYRHASGRARATCTSPPVFLSDDRPDANVIDATIWPPSRSLKSAPTAAGVLVGTSTASFGDHVLQDFGGSGRRDAKDIDSRRAGSCRILCIRSVAGNIVVDDDVARKVLSWVWLCIATPGSSFPVSVLPTTTLP